MQEEFEEEKSEALDLGRYLDIVRRRHMHFLVPLFVGWALVWGSSWFLQARYKSSTLILVQQPSMPSNYVAPNVNDDLQERLQSIQQQILSRTRLLQIIRSLNLYRPKPHHPLTDDDQVEKMRKDISIELVRDSQNQEITAFRIYYSAPDPHIAQRVTGELTNLFIDANLRVRQQESEDTTRFIQDQLANARVSLAQQEAQIRDFEREHEGELPTQQTTNLQILSGLQGQLQNEEDALNSAMQQKVYYQTLVDQYRTLRGGASATGEGPADLPAVDEQLTKLRARLADLSTRYTDQYPDVQSTKREIERTEKLRDQLLAAEKEAAAAGKQNKAEAAPPVLSDPEKAGPLLQLQSQLRANVAEISNREKAIAQLKDRIEQYQARLNAEPASEQKLNDLSRGYEQSKANYDDLLKKEHESRMATSMEEMQQGERFTMLDPPSLPLKPDFPNRLKMCGAGLGVGLVLGLLVVVGLEFFDDRIHSDKEIRNMLSMPVISEIPAIISAADEQRSRRQVILGWAMAAMVFVTILAGTAFSYLRD